MMQKVYSLQGTPTDGGHWYGTVFVPEGNAIRTAILPVGELPNVLLAEMFLISRFPQIDADGRELWWTWVWMEALP